jgi:hypothetical protein
MPQAETVGSVDILLGSCSVGMVRVRTLEEDSSVAVAVAVAVVGGEAEPDGAVDAGGDDGHPVRSSMLPMQADVMRRATRPSTGAPHGLRSGPYRE